MTNLFRTESVSIWKQGFWRSSNVMSEASPAADHLPWRQVMRRPSRRPHDRCVRCFFESPQELCGRRHGRHGTCRTAMAGHAGFLRSRWLLCQKPCRLCPGENHLGTGFPGRRVVSRKLTSGPVTGFLPTGPQERVENRRVPRGKPKNTGPGGRSWGSLGTTFHLHTEP